MEVSFVNELEVMKKCYSINNLDLGCDLSVIMAAQARALSLKSASVSKKIRLEANSMMILNENSKAAASLYTKAIITAPFGNENVGLAYANRSNALRELGFLQAAYDDCVLALESDYPNDLRYIISYIQAELCTELGDVKTFLKHFDELAKMELNDVYNNGVEALISKVLEDGYSFNHNIPKEESDEIEDHIKIGKGRTLITTKPIKKGETIFTDQAFIICPKKDAEICHNCGMNCMIPYPCVRCPGYVRYCSFKCQKEHYDVHKYECLFYGIDLEDKNTKACNNQGIYMRLLIKGLQQVLPYLKDKKNANALWSKCFDEGEHSKLPYIQILQAETSWNTDKKIKERLRECMDACKTMIGYLETFTNFFDLFVNTKASKNDWKIFIGAILLRHMGQRKLILWEKSFLSTKGNGLNSIIIPKGSLFFAYKEKVSAAFVFPKIASICKNQCTNMIALQIDGTKLMVSAGQDIHKETEINDSFIEQTPTEFSKSERQQLFQERFQKKCKCLFCKTNANQYFENAHTFSCQSLGCEKQFSINTIGQLEHDLVCSHCKVQQKDTNLFKLMEEMATFVCSDPLTRGIILSKMRKFEQICVGNSLPKLNNYFYTIVSFLRSHHHSMSLTPDEWNDLQSIALKGLTLLEQLHISITPKLKFIMAVWDIIVLRNEVIDKTLLQGTIIWLKKNTAQIDYVKFMEYYSNNIVPLIKND